jgi:CheY-like chemotaxis protein
MELAGFNAFNRYQLFCRKVSSHDRVTKATCLVSWRALRVLVIVDEQETAQGLGSLVRRWGHAADLAQSAVAALKLAADRYPDIVLLDIKSSLMDGCQIARRLRLDSSNEECFIIAFMGQIDVQQRQQCSESGIDLVLTKPVDPEIVETLLMLECERVNRAA